MRSAWISGAEGTGGDRGSNERMRYSLVRGQFSVFVDPSPRLSPTIMPSHASSQAHCSSGSSRTASDRLSGRRHSDGGVGISGVSRRFALLTGAAFDRRSSIIGGSPLTASSLGGRCRASKAVDPQLVKKHIPNVDSAAGHVLACQQPPMPCHSRPGRRPSLRSRPLLRWLKPSADARHG